MYDFQNASERHLQDAELLFTQAPKRLANASHFFGLSAECSLKAIAQKLKPSTKFGGRNGLGHIPKLFSELKNVFPEIGSNPDLVRHMASIQPKFANWNVAQRYASKTIFIEATVADEQAGSNAAHLLMSNCMMGLI